MAAVEMTGWKDLINY